MVLVGKSEGRRSLRRYRRRSEDNIKTDRREVGWGDMDWVNLVQDGDKWRALVNTVLNFQVPAEYLVVSQEGLSSEY
jgi:hypothetical protein